MRILLIILFLIITQNVISQHKSDKKLYKIESKSLVTGVPETDGCAAACATILFSEAIYFIIDVMADHHEYLLDNLDTYPEAVSFEGMFLAAGGTDSRLSVLPRIRGTAGVFSTDFRFNQGSSFGNSSTDQFFEWQIIEFNTYPVEKVNFRFGTGILYDLVGNSTYNEHHLSLETKFFENKMSFLFEGRYSADYAKLVDVYSEITLSAKVKAINYSHLRGYFIIGGIYQNFYSVKDISGLQVGLQFTIH